MLRLETLVEKARDIEALEPLCKEALDILGIDSSKGLYQIELIGEKDRYIIYKPLKFIDPKRKDGKIVLVYDLVYLK